MKKLIQVTEEDIVAGLPNFAEKCPIARALKREFPSAFVIWVGYSGSLSLPTAKIDIEHQPRLISRLGTRASKFIKRFDRGKTVKPFKFWFKVDDVSSI